MQFSGYDEKKDIRRLMISMKQTKGERRKYGRKMNKNKSWYLKDRKSETVMFVNVTPNERLKRKTEQTAKKYKMKVKVVGWRGRKMKRLHQKVIRLGR